MKLCTNPFEALSLANSSLSSHGLNLLDNEWASEILSIECARYYEGGAHYAVTIHINEAGFRKVKSIVDLTECPVAVYTVDVDHLTRIKVTFEDWLHLLVLVPEEVVDETMAF